MVQVLLADSNLIVREGLQSIINRDEGLNVSAAAATSMELREQLKEFPIDVIMIDYMSINFDLEDIAYVQRMHPEVGVVAITPPNRKDRIEQVMRQGIDGHIMKDCRRDEIVDSLLAAAKSERYFCGKVVHALGAGSEDMDEISCEGLGLSNREIEIIQQISAGKTNKQIADELFLSAHTVNTHRKNVMSKLGINNTAGLVMYAVKERLISPNKFLFNPTSSSEA